MKYKTLFIILSVVLILLIYFGLCYRLANNPIEKQTKSVISKYLKTNNINDYEFIKAFKFEENNYNIYIKANDDYYNFVLDNNYNIIDVSNKIPCYIK